MQGILCKQSQSMHVKVLREMTATWQRYVLPRVVMDELDCAKVDFDRSRVFQLVDPWKNDLARRKIPSSIYNTAECYRAAAWNEDRLATVDALDRHCKFVINIGSYTMNIVAVNTFFMTCSILCATSQKVDLFLRTCVRWPRLRPVIARSWKLCSIYVDSSCQSSRPLWLQVVVREDWCRHHPFHIALRRWQRADGRKFKFEKL